LREALAIFQKVLPDGHPDIAISLDNLAGLLSATGRYAEAEPLYRRIMAIYEQTLSPEHPNIAVGLVNLALVLQVQGRYGEAEPLHYRVLAIQEKAFGPEHPNITFSLNSLALVFQAQGRHNEAETLLHRALAIQEKTLGSEDPDTASSLTSLASVLNHQGRYAEAEALFRRALAIQEKVFGPEHLDTTATTGLGLVLTMQGKYAKAETLLRRALAIQEKVFGPEHPLTAIQLNYLAELLRTQGQYAEAEVLLRRALVISDKSLGPDHPNTATILSNLAEVLRVQGQYAEAEVLLRRALVINDKSIGRNHPYTATILNNLALVSQAQHRYSEAEASSRRALTIREKTLGPDHPDTGQSLNNLALMLHNQGHMADAEVLFRRAVALKGNDLLRLMIYSANLGSFLVEQNRLTEAIAPYDTAVETLDRLFANTRGLSEDARHTFVGQYAYIYRDFIKLLLQLHAQDAKAGYDRKALEVVSRQQSRIFSELLRQAQVRLYEHDPVFQDLKAQRTSRCEQIAALTAQWATVLPTTPDAAAKIANLDRLRDEQRQALHTIEAQLRQDYPRFSELEQPAPVTVETLQALLQPGEAVWTVALLPEQTALFVVTRDRFHLQPVPVARQTVTDLVARLRQPLDRAGQSGELTTLPDLDPADLHQLYQHLIAPIAAHLQDTPRLLVIADGPLYTLPLEMLVTHFDRTDARAFRHARRAADGHDPAHALLSEYALLDYLDTHYRLHYLPSLAALVAQRRPTRSAPAANRRRAPAPPADSAAPVAAPTAADADPNADPTPPALIAFADPIFTPPAAPTPTPSATASDPPTPTDPSTTPGYSPATEATRQLLTRSGALPSALQRLPESAAEARALATLFHVPDRHLYLRARAQEHTLYALNDQGRLRDLRYLLFSTHGLLGGQFLPPPPPDAPTGPRLLTTRTGPAPSAPPPEPREPALALTLVGDLHGEDGFLKMGEVLGLDLNADLVILSACNTAGEITADATQGEGFVGLTRAFLFAGAQRLWVSHWRVASTTTRDLMQTAFAHLHAGQTPAAALASARQTLRQQTVPLPAANGFLATAHPLFWAPFVVVGD